jgi:hypothetical protein
MAEGYQSAAKGEQGRIQSAGRIFLAGLLDANSALFPEQTDWAQPNPRKN